MNVFLQKIFFRTKIIVLLAVFLLNVSFPVFADENKNINEETLEILHKWMNTIQLSNGAIPMYGGDTGETTIVPYFSSITATAIIKYDKSESSLETAKKYFDWYFAHLNEDESIGVGTIYDYKALIEERNIIDEWSKGSFDSADSYAALFLSSLWEYVIAGGDREYIIEHEEQIEIIIELLTSLIDDDGLACVSYKNKTKYLMDNCETALGLYSASKLMDEIFAKQYKLFSYQRWEMIIKIIELKVKRNNLIKAININLWDAVNQRYAIAKNGNGNILYVENYDKFYPNAIAQIFPIIYGVINPKSLRAEKLYDEFCTNFEWEDISHYKNEQSSFYWAVTAYCGAVMGDDVRVNRYIENFAELSLPELKYPLYNADAAWVVLAGIYN